MKKGLRLHLGAGVLQRVGRSPDLMKKGLRRSPRNLASAIAATEPGPYEEGIKTTKRLRPCQPSGDGAQTL